MILFCRICRINYDVATWTFVVTSVAKNIDCEISRRHECVSRSRRVVRPLERMQIG